MAHIFEGLSEGVRSVTWCDMVGPARWPEGPQKCPWRPPGRNRREPTETDLIFGSAGVDLVGLDPNHTPNGHS